MADRQIGNGRVGRKEADLATYRALADIDLGIRFPYVQAGTILVDGPGGNIPNNWNPTACEPLDAGGLAAYYAAGPQFSPVLQHWTGLNVVPPLTFWKFASGANPNRFYQLQGLGIGLPPVLGGS
jgi:hypothetical protein